MDTVQLPITPTADMRQLDALINRLEGLQAKGFNIPVNLVGNLEGFQKQMAQIAASAPSMSVGGGMAAAMEDAGVFASSLVTKLKALGEVDAARKLEGGFKSTAAEVAHLDRLYDEMTAKMRSSARNPQNLISGKMHDWEAALNLISLRSSQLAEGSRAAMEEPRDKALFDQARSARSKAAKSGDEFAGAEENVATAARRSQSELAAQEAVLKSKAGMFEKARNAAQQFEKSETAVAAASGKSAAAGRTAASSENAMIRERLKNGKSLEKMYAESPGTTRRETTGKDSAVFTDVNRLREAQAAVKGITEEAGRHIGMMKSEGATAREINAVYRAYSSQLERLAIKYRDLDQAGVTSIGRQSVALRQLGQRGINTETRQVERQQQAAADALQRQRSRALIAQERERERLAQRTTQTSGGGGGGGPLSDITGTVKNAATFIGVYRALDLVVQGLETGIKDSVEFERRFATLSIIFRGTKEEARELAIETLKTAAALGQNGVEALQVATDFARFGLSQTQTLEAVRVVALAANVAQIDLAESSKHFQAIMAGYSLDAGQLASVLGSLNTISNTYNVTTKSLLEGLARVAPLARQAGIGLNELAGFEAVITGRTSRPGAEAGNAIKSLIARITKPATQGALQEVGVNVHDQSGELKTTSQIINETFVAYQNLTRAEQQELLVKVAGTQQASRIAALLDGYVQSQELAIRASRDLTSSDRENTAVRATLSSQLGTLKTKWQEFWVAGAGAGQASGIQGTLTDMVMSLSNMLTILTKISSLGSKGSHGADISKAIDDATTGLPLMNIGGTFRRFNRDTDAIGSLFPKGETEAALDQLQQFNAQLEKLQKLGEADESASRLFKTIGAAIKNASPEKLEAMVRAAAQVAEPGNLPKQEDLRAELLDLAKSGDYLELNARLSELSAAAQKSRNAELQKANNLLNDEMAKQTAILHTLEKQRSEAARKNRPGDVASLDKQIEQKQNELSALRGRQAGTFAQLFPEGEEQYKSEPLDVSGIKNSVSSLAKELSKARGGSKSEELDKDILAARLGFELERKRIEALVERGRVSRSIANDAISDLQKERDQTIENVEFARQYADLIDRQTYARKEAADATKGFRSGRDEAESIARERAALLGSARRESVTGLPLNIAAARQEVAGATSPEARAAAIARLQEFGLRLERLGEETLGRKLTLEADITREREKQALETSKNLLMADRETQLRAALAQKLIQSRGGRGFSAGEFGFFDQKEKQAISQGAPNLLPPEFQTRLAELIREYGIAKSELASYNATLAGGRKIQDEANKAMAEMLNKLNQGTGGGVSANISLDGVSGVLSRGGAAIEGTLSRLGDMLQARDSAIIGAITLVSDRVARFERGGIQTAIGRVQGAAQLAP